MVRNAVQEMLAFLAEWLDKLNVRDNDIPKAVRALEFAKIGGVVGGFDALIIDLNFL